MTENPPTCHHCGWFIAYELPKAPDMPRWVHTPYRPDKPAEGAHPCEAAEPKSAAALSAEDRTYRLVGNYGSDASRVAALVVARG